MIFADVGWSVDGCVGSSAGVAHVDNGHPYSSYFQTTRRHWWVFYCRSRWDVSPYGSDQIHRTHLSVTTAWSAHHQLKLLTRSTLRWRARRTVAPLSKNWPVSVRKRRHDWSGFSMMCNGQRQPHWNCLHRVSLEAVCHVFKFFIFSHYFFFPVLQQRGLVNTLFIIGFRDKNPPVALSTFYERVTGSPLTRAASATPRRGSTEGRKRSATDGVLDLRVRPLRVKAVRVFVAKTLRWSLEDGLLLQRGFKKINFPLVFLR